MENLPKSIETPAFICKELVLLTTVFLFLPFLPPIANIPILGVLLRLGVAAAALWRIRRAAVDQRHSSRASYPLAEFAQVLLGPPALLGLWLGISALLPGDGSMVLDSQDTVLLILLALLSAVAEELFFREYLPGRLQSAGLSVIAALTLSSVLFAVGHGYGGPAGLAFAFLAGLLLGAARLFPSRRGLLRAILVHGLYNIGTILIHSFLPEA